MTPNSVNEDGTCPTCGDTIQLPEGEPDADTGTRSEGADEKAPWHFKLMMATVTVYLGWRLVQGIQHFL